LAWNFFLEGSAVVNSERQHSFRWVLAGVLLIAAFLGLRWAATQAQDRDRQIEELRAVEAEARARAAAAKEKLDKLLVEQQEELIRKAQTGEAALLPQRHFLEKGKSYVFCWQINVGPAVVLEEPRNNWVKVRTSDGYDQWINLSTVHRVLVVPEGKGKKDTDKTGEDADQAARKDVQRLQGRWVAESVGGKKLPKGHQVQILFEGEKVVWTNLQEQDLGNGKIGGSAGHVTFTFKVDPKKQPAGMDFTATEGTFQGRVFPSIYALVGETLTICRSQPGTDRPTDFTTKEGSDHYLLILKRSAAVDEK
jgi:uncharacterized protein (TIGR03067 family)